MNVFVYGTLLSGESNNYLLSKSILLGEEILPGLEMHDLGMFPACVVSSDENSVIGEVWEVTDEVFKRLDHLEGYPIFYDRIQVKTTFGQTWVYIREKARTAPVICTGNWRERLRNEIK